MWQRCHLVLDSLIKPSDINYLVVQKHYSLPKVTSFHYDKRISFHFSDWEANAKKFINSINFFFNNVVARVENIAQTNIATSTEAKVRPLK